MTDTRETRELHERLSTGVKAGALVVLLGLIALSAQHNEFALTEMGAIPETSETAAQPAAQPAASEVHYLPSQFGAPAEAGAASELPPTF